MSSVTPVAEKLLTAEEYLELPDDERVTELIPGRVVEGNRPESLHGFYCSNIAGQLRAFVRPRKLGRVVCNESGVITRRGPDTVRGGDVHFYSYSRVARGTALRGYWPAPDLIFEVKSDSDRWLKVISKVQEYLEANVRVVVVVDPQERRAHVYTPDQPPFVVDETSQLDLGVVLPDVLPECKLTINEFLKIDPWQPSSEQTLMSISSLPPSTEKLVTAAEFLTLPDDGRRTELVRGKIIEMPPTRRAHGKVCLALASILSKYIDQFDMGHGSVNDSGVVTEENPDTVRGADAAFCSYLRIPKDALPVGYWPESPEIVFEVLSPSDRPGRTFTKVTEYLDAGVIAVVLIDPEDY